jgi:hypothetical protein
LLLSRYTCVQGAGVMMTIPIYVPEYTYSSSVINPFLLFYPFKLWPIVLHYNDGD